MLSTTNKLILAFFDDNGINSNFDDFIINSIVLHGYFAKCKKNYILPQSHNHIQNELLTFGKYSFLTNSYEQFNDLIDKVTPVDKVAIAPINKVITLPASNNAIAPVDKVATEPVDKVAVAPIVNVMATLNNNVMIASNKDTTADMDNKYIVAPQATMNSDPVLINIHNELTKINNRFLSSSEKGRISENIIYNELRHRMPLASIIFNRHTPQSADIIIDRTGHTKIIIENKDWNKPIAATEVDKFIRDIEHTGHSGILVSQTSSIANINSFHFKIINKSVAMFIGNCNYECGHIMIAIHIIDQILLQIHEISTNNDGIITIDTDKSTHIIQEIQLFALKKQQIITLINSMQKAMDELQIPIISELFKIARPKIQSEFMCDKCGKTLKSKGGLTRHIKACAS
jgi:hypothetical protein